MIASNIGNYHRSYFVFHKSAYYWFTLDVYGHVTNQMQEASAVRMEAYIKGILNL